MDTRISIVTPSLNQGQYIEQCIDSVLSQGYKNLQYIVIDGGSSDESVEIIKKYEKHLDYWVSESDNGQSHAINKGLKKVSGDVFNWINSDDYLEKNSLKTINEAFTDPSTKVFSGKSNLIKDGKIIGQSTGLDLYPNNLAKTIGLARIDQPETYWRTDVLDKIGPLNSNLHFIMDRDWWVRFLLTFGLDGIVNSDQIIANFRLHDASKTVSQRDSFNAERNRYFKTLSDHYKVKVETSIFNDSPIIEGVNFPESENNEVVKKSMNYFLFLIAQEKYAESDFRSFTEVVQHINPDLLEETDSEFLQKLRRRTQVIPSAVHKTLKRFR